MEFFTTLQGREHGWSACFGRFESSPQIQVSFRRLQPSLLVLIRLLPTRLCACRHPKVHPMVEMQVPRQLSHPYARTLTCIASRRCLCLCLPHSQIQQFYKSTYEVD